MVQQSHSWAYIQKRRKLQFKKKKRKEIVPHAAMWMNLENTGEVSQRKTNAI